MDPPANTDTHFAVAWLDEHGDQLYAYALARVGGDGAVAEDLVQDTLLAAIKAYPGFKGDASLATWLIGILRRKVVDHYRRAGRNREAVVEEAFFDEHGSIQNVRPWAGDAERLCQTKEFMRVFAECLAELRPPLAEAFTLVVMDGLSTEEACSVLGITPTNLSVRLHRARLALRERLQARWFGDS